MNLIALSFNQIILSEFVFSLNFASDVSITIRNIRRLSSLVPIITFS